MVEKVKNRKLALSFISNLAEEVGLVLCGASERYKLGDEESRRLEDWQERGFAGEMHYMTREARERCDASFHEPWVKTVLSFASPYSAVPHSLDPKRGYGRVARYAWGKDYHKVLKKKLSRLYTLIHQRLGIELNWRPITDSFPLLERAFARQAGMGFIGKNTMLIKPGVGSYIFLCEVLTDLSVDVDVSSSLPEGQGCGSCNRCLTSCPTDAFNEAFQLDARKCISYLTIEKRGSLDVWERRAIGSWLFGCDVCQEVCPFNHRAQKGLVPIRVKEFESSAGVGEDLSLLQLFDIKNDEGFVERFAGTPLMRAKRVGVVRNALCVAVNQEFREGISKIQNIARDDEDSTLRELAEWALGELE